jgi:gliding motility-associated-like protein
LPYVIEKSILFQALNQLIIGILVFLVACGEIAHAQFSVAPSDPNACNCTGGLTYQPASSLPYTLQLFDSENIPVLTLQDQIGITTLNNLCPSVFHVVAEFSNGQIVDHYFSVSAGNSSLGDAHKVILCQESYKDGSGNPIPFDLTPELSSFVPGGNWYTPEGLLIPDFLLTNLTAQDCDSGWYTYVVNSNGCNVTSGVYIQTNNIGLTTTYVICETYDPFYMIEFMQGDPDTIGVWYDNNVSIVDDGIFDPAIMDDALFTYVIDNLPGCLPSYRTMYVDEQIQNSAGESASLLACSSGSSINMLAELGGTPIDGGFWSGPDGPVLPMFSDIFFPGTMSAGDYIYTISSSAPCASLSSTLSITITTDNPSGLSNAITVCSTANPSNLFDALAGNPLVGGTWTSPSGQATDEIFDPQTEPAGTYTYYYPNLGCPPVGSSLNISVEAPVNAGSNGSASICQSVPVFNLNSMLSSNASQSGNWFLDNQPIAANYTPSTAGTFNLTYSVNALACADDIASFTLAVQSTTPIPSNQSAFICSLGGPINLADYFTGYPNVYFETQSGALVSNQFNPAVQTDVVYNVINQSVNECPDQSAQITIDVIEPVFETSSTSIDFCRSAAVLDLNNSLPSAASGQGTWYDQNDVTVSGNVSLNFDGIQHYYYEVIQPITCGNNQFHVDLVSFSPPEAGNDFSELFCFNEPSVAFNVLVPQNADAGGTWLYQNFPISSTAFNPATDSPGTYSYRMAANGPCPADEAFVELAVQYGINYSAGPDIHVCAGSESQTLGTPAVSGVVYDWTPSTGLSSTAAAQPQLDIPGNLNQTYSAEYFVTATDAVCTITENVTVIVEPKPEVTLAPEFDICFGESLTIPSVSSANCSWTPTNLFTDPFISAPSLQPTSSVYIGVSATSDFGCVTNKFSQVNVNALPLLFLEIPSGKGCSPLAFYAKPDTSSRDVDQLVWNLAGVGTFLGDSLSLNLTQPGIYDLEVTAISEHNCISSIFFEEVAEVLASPVASFRVEPQQLSTLQPVAEFTNFSVGANSYAWDFSGIAESNEIHPTFQFPSTQNDNFLVCLHVVHPDGCADSTCRNIVMEAEYVVFAPNAFTPDGDGDNDFWIPVVSGLEIGKYELSIFNRWGERVFFSDDPEAPWTGNIKQGDYFGQNEVYNWLLKLRMANNAEEIEFSGNVILIR